MALTITIVSVLVLIGLGAWGWWRGVPRGLLSLIITLFGAALVDLWVDTWGRQMQSWLRLERSQTSTWLAATIGFLVVALFIGYGSGRLVRPGVDSAARSRMLAGPVGALLGVLNGALMVGYMLKYTSELLRRADITSALQSSIALRTLTVWLPWFLLAVVLAAAVVVLGSILGGILAFIMTPRSPGKARTGSTNTQVANASTTAGKMDAVSNKISEVLGEKKR